MAVTLHNIPEGMAVGLSFLHWRPEKRGDDRAMALAVRKWHPEFSGRGGDFLPLRQEEGEPAWKAFLMGSLCGSLETQNCCGAFRQAG